MTFTQKIKDMVLGSGVSLNPGIFEKIPLPVVLLRPVDDKFYIVNATDELCRMTLASRENIIGKEVPVAFPDEEKVSWWQLEASFRKVIETELPDHIGMIRYDLTDSVTGEKHEKYWEIQNSPIRDSTEKKTLHIWHTVIDKTPEVLLERLRKETENEKLSRKERNQVFIKENSDGLYSLDTAGRFMTANAGLAQIAETPGEELLKMDFLPFCAEHDKEKILELFQKGVQGTPQNFEADFVSGRGRNMVLNINLIPMIIDGVSKGVYGIAKDVTLLRSSEKNLNQKRMFLDLYSQIIDYLVSYGPDTKNLEYIFAQIGKTVGGDRIFYLGDSLKNKEGKTIISDNIHWSRDLRGITSQKPDLYWFNCLVAHFGPFEYDTPVLLNVDKCGTQDQKNLLEQVNGGSLLILPLFHKKEFHGVVGFESHCALKTWHEEEIDFLRSLLKNILSFVEKKISHLEVEKKERELLGTEKKFEFMVQEGSDLIGILDADGTYKFVSASSSGILGIPPEEFIGMNAFDFIHPEDKDFVFAQFSSIASQRQINIPPFRFKDSQGKWRWVETTATNLLKVPEVEGIVTNSRDITSEVERSQEIRELNERYRLAASATRDLIYDWDLITDDVTRYLEGKEQLFGYSLNIMKERDFWRNHVHPDDIENMVEILEDTLNNQNADEINTQYRFRKSDGSYAHLIDRGRIIRDENGKALRLIGATSDISEITSNRNALKLANIRFNYAMKATREMMWDWDVREDTILRSKAFKKIYGYDETEKPSKENFWFSKVVLKDRERVRKSLVAALGDPKITKWKDEYRFYNVKGEKVYVVDRGYIVRDKEGKAVRMVGATLDVSESRRLIKETKKQNKVLKDIAWEQAHLVRGPLTRLMGLVHMQKQKLYEEWDQNELVDLISLSAKELDDIVIKIIRKSEDV